MNCIPAAGALCPGASTSGPHLRMDGERGSWIEPSASRLVCGDGPFMSDFVTRLVERQNGSVTDAGSSDELPHVRSQWSGLADFRLLIDVIMNVVLNMPATLSGHSGTATSLISLKVGGRFPVRRRMSPRYLRAEWNLLLSPCEHTPAVVKQSGRRASCGTESMTIHYVDAVSCIRRRIVEQNTLGPVGAAAIRS